MSTSDIYSSHISTTAVGEPETDDVAEARAKIDETRAHLSSTVDAIKEMLSPAHIVEEAKEAVLGKAHDVVSDAVDTMKNASTAVADTASDLYHAAVDKVTDLGHAVSDKASEIGHAVSDKVSDITGGGTNKYPAYAYSNSRGFDRSRGATIVDTIKLNPLPAALIGFGVGWLVLSIQKQQRVEQLGVVTPTPSTPTYDIYGDSAYGTSTGYAYDSTGRTANSLTDRASDVVHGVSDKVSDAAHTVSQKATDLGQTVSQKASDITQSVSQKASDLSGRASDWAGGVRDSAGQWKDKAGDTVNNLAVQTKVQAGAASDSVVTFISEQPLAAAGIAFIIGAAFATSLPTTQKENEILGPKRDQLVDQGKGAAQDVAQKVQTVASAAFGQAKDSLSQTVDQAKQQLHDTVQQTHDAVVNEAHNQGLVGTPA